jgi:23S rRNA (pseudouridine1915-N3)-methyltransferase
MISSEKLSAQIERFMVEGGSELAWVIGSSWGLAEIVKNRAVMRLSMSRMTFPHQLARVMLCEQLYRAFQISTAGKYHK